MKLNQIFTKFFGSRNTRVLNRLWKVVNQINALEPEMESLSDEALGQKTQEFKNRIANGESLSSLLPEAFAVVREASKRTMGMRHFDVQLIGAMVLDGGNIAEMRTGEGKTLMSTLAAYLNTLGGHGVHVVTVNDYLARRDAEWMRPLYEFLNLSVGVNLANMSREEKQSAYAADITYGTNNEFGFDYLRDNMVYSKEDKVQRSLSFAIIDEVDSILIDEARTPLIISGSADESVHLYEVVDRIIPQLVQQQEKDGPGDYSLDEKTKQAFLTEDGHQRVEELLLQAGLIQEGESLYDAHNVIMMHHVYAALRAHRLFQLDVDYLVQNNEVVIVDEHTGRTMPGRRWSDGLHQAIEAKEGVKINQENQTLASITFQNYFRLYNKLSGMTGTADTEAYEFQQIYGLEVVVIPTHRPMIRVDAPDFVYMTTEDKFKAIVADIKETTQTGQPILVGTASIEASELLSRMLRQDNITHQVLNAKFHEREAEIVAEAGRPGAVTIATNMAGRGTDIVLGGNLQADISALEEPSELELARLKEAWQKRHDQVIESGGLYVLGSERHESRRIDNQLRGRSGRQGDPGKSRFYLSLQDNLLRIFGGDRLNSIMQRIGMEEGVALESRILSRSIENAQRKVEAYNFDVRKQLLEFDDVANEQRKVIYRQRDELLLADDISELIGEIGKGVVKATIDVYIPPMSMEEEWDIEGLQDQLEKEFNMRLNLKDWLADDETVAEEQLRKRITDTYVDVYGKKVQEIGSDVIKPFEKGVMLQTLDNCWREHLAAMDYLRQGIHLRGYAQKNPKQEYKRESFEMFGQLLARVNHDVITTLLKFEPTVERTEEEMIEQQRQVQQRYAMEYKHVSIDALHHESNEQDDDVAVMQKPLTRSQPKVGRNQACPCGSGKKYKVCHGTLD